MVGPPPLLRLAPALRTQFGVVSTGQADRLGVSRPTLATLCDAGLLQRVHRGVYRCTVTADSWEARALAGLLAAGPEASLGRWAAARLLGLVRTTTTTLDLVVPRGANVRPCQPRPRTSLRLTPGDLATVRPFRCTDAAWTIGELAAVSRPAVLARITGRAVSDGLVTVDELRGVAERLRGVPGVVQLRAVVGASTEAVPGTRSRPERRFIALVVRHGLPRPIANLRVRDAAGELRELDAAWLPYRVFADIDVHPSHATSLGRRIDGWRQNDLVPDWLPLRFDAHDLDHRPGEVVEVVRRALVARGWEG